MLKKMVLFVLISFPFSVIEASPLSLMSEAALKGDIEEIRRLISGGADVNAPYEVTGYTPLHFACSMFNFNLDGNPCFRMRFGRRMRMFTPPCRHTYLLIVTALLEAGADVYACNLQGQQPPNMTCNPECIELLNNHIKYLENIGRRTKAAIRESSTSINEGASSVVDKPEDDEEVEKEPMQDTK